MKKKVVILLILACLTVLSVSCLSGCSTKKAVFEKYYTVSAEKSTAELPQAQEDRQYKIESYESLEKFSEAYGVDLTKEVDKSLFQDHLLLVMVADNMGESQLDSLYIDQNQQPHMVIHESDAQKTAEGLWAFAAVIPKQESKEMDLKRWAEY